MSSKKPSPATRREVIDATHRASELPSTFRVYRKEFLFEWRDAIREHLVIRFQEVYGGRIRDEDWEIRESVFRPSRPFELWIRRWNVFGEYKHESDAESAAERNRGRYEVEVVPRNSRAEHILMQYGKVRL